MKYPHGKFVVTTVTTVFQDPKTTRRQLQDVSSLILSQCVALRRHQQPSTLRDFNDITAKLSKVYVLVLKIYPSISYASKIMWSLKHFLYE